MRRVGSSAHQRFTAKQLGHLGHQILCLRASDSLAGHEDDIVSVCGRGRNLTPGLPQDPPSSIPLNGASHTTGGDHRGVLGARREEQYHPLPVH